MIINYKDEALRFLQIQANKIQLSQLQKEYFITTCEANELNPFQKDIYIIGSGANVMFVVSYDAYLKRADTQPDRGGEEFETITDDNGNLKAIRCNIYKINQQTNQRYKFLDFEALLNEFKGNTALWRTKPMVMLRKCSHANALRQAYPTMWKVPVYTEDEINDVEPNQPVPVQPLPSIDEALPTSPLVNTKRINPNQTAVVKSADEVEKLNFFNNIQTKPMQSEPEPIKPADEANIDYLGMFVSVVRQAITTDKCNDNDKFTKQIRDYFNDKFGLDGVMKKEDFDQLKASVKKRIVNDLQRIIDDSEYDELENIIEQAKAE